jgi:hypothetical protein
MTFIPADDARFLGAVESVACVAEVGDLYSGSKFSEWKRVARETCVDMGLPVTDSFVGLVASRARQLFIARMQEAQRACAE